MDPRLLGVSRRSLVGVLVVPMFLFFALMVATTSAQAAEWDIATKNGGWSKNNNQSGHAISDGQITFDGPRRVEFDVYTLSDKCNPEGTNDGVGAWISIAIKYTDGDIDYGGPLATDLNGCNNGFQYVYDVRLQTDKRIKSARVELAECDSLGCSWYEQDWAFSTWKDNPHTG